MSAIVHPRPRLRSIESADDFEMDLEFQFVPTGFTLNKQTNWAEASGLNREHPILQWANGAQETIGLEAKWWAQTTDDNVDAVIAKLREAASPVPRLGRPPILVFTWGRVIGEFVVIDTLGNISIDEIRPDGSHQGFLFRLVLRRYDFFDLEVTDPNAPPSSTFFVVARDGDMWETLAAREYRDALKGVLVGRLNPDKPTLVPGQRVALPDFEEVRDQVVQPESPPLARTEEGVARRREFFELRSGSLITHIGTVGG